MKDETTAILHRHLTKHELDRLSIIVRTGNISRACKHAGISLPTWSRIYKANGPTKTTTIALLLNYADKVKKAAKKELISS